VGWGDILSACQVGEGSRQLEDAVVGASGELPFSLLLFDLSRTIPQAGCHADLLEFRIQSISHK
jgi:hypothetical protein